MKFKKFKVFNHHWVQSTTKRKYFEKASENINTYLQTGLCCCQNEHDKKIEITPIYLYLGKGGLQTL